MAMFDSVDKNGDAWICQKKLPGDEMSTTSWTTRP
jgi:hypothetical protein